MFDGSDGKTEMRTIGEAIEDWGLNGGLWSFRQYLRWKRTNYQTLPFPGIFNEQPDWLCEDFDTLDLVSRWHELNEKAMDVKNLPRTADIA